MATKPIQAAPAASQDPEAADTPTPQGGDVGGQLSQDKIIAAVQAKVRETIPAQFRVAVQKIYLAGMKLMFSPETHELMLQQLKGNDFTAQAVARGIAALITLMYRQSKGTMPIPAVVPAAILLACEALDYLEQTGKEQVSSELISDVVQQVVAILLQKVGLTPDDVANGVNKNAQAAGMHVPGTLPTPTAASTTPGAGGLVQQQMGASNG